MVKSVQTSFQHIFESVKVEQIARKTGFLKRKSKLSPQAFIDLMFYAASGENTSLLKISNEAKSEHDLVMSKQGLDNRFSTSSVEFSKALLAEALSEKVENPLSLCANSPIKRVLVKDSTRFIVDNSLKDKFPGYGGRSSEAGVSIQFEYDIVSGRITDTDLQSEVSRDSKDAAKKKESIQSGDLIIRDLGYYSLDVCKTISKNNAFFISRLFHTANVYESADSRKEVDFNELHRQMQSKQLEYTEINVFIGKERFPMRLVVCLLPNDIYESRVRNLNAKNIKRGYQTSDRYKARAHFNLFVCNLDVQFISAEEICKLYRVRWQIELIFKTWKSFMKINRLHKMKYERLVTTIYMNLLWIVVYWRIILPFRNYQYEKELRLISHLKCMNTLIQFSGYIRKMLRLTKIQIGIKLRKIFDILSIGHWLEKRKNKVSFEELLFVLFCISDIY